MMPINAGTRLGRYEIRSSLGAGGMGEVYLAYDTSLRRQVAVKLLPAEFTQNKLRLSRFEREAYAASSLNHPYILTIYEIGEQGGQHFIATEYIEGESLRHHMARTRMELREVLDVASQVTSALSAAHQAGIVHRDIKPENIMLRQDGFVKVLDFGLAKLADAAVAAQPEATDAEAPTKTKVVNTEPGVVMGTASYMSPEQARGLEVDARTDIWSLGVMLYEMVAGRLPFEGATTTDVLTMILHREPPSLLLYRKDVPAELERIVEKALTKEKEERYQLAKDLGLDLKRLKQRLEMEAELERSITPEEEARQASGRLSVGSREPAISGTTQAAAAAPTAEASAAHTVSSAEYVVGEIKRHKRGALLVLATLLIAVAATFAYNYFARGGRTAIGSIAVLPFTNTSGDANMEYLSDGISESLINALSQLPQLKVIARSSAFKYKGKEVDPQEVAKALGVQAVVTGRVVQRGDNLQISAEMVDVRDKTQLWGEQYSRKLTDVQAVQEEIARTISEKLRLRLSGAQEQQLAKRATANPEAYQLYLNGVFYRRKGGLENGRKALDYYNQAVALDPNFALAWTGVADAYRYLQANGVLDPKEAHPKAKAAAQKALELDEGLAEAHVALGLIKMDEWDWAGAEHEFNRATELNPNLAEAHHRYSVYLTNVGRHTEALAEIKRAQELDPLRIVLRDQEGAALYFARRYDEAVQQLQNVIKLDPDDRFAHAYLGYTYEAKGMYAQAIAEYQKRIRIEGETTSTLCYLGYALAMSGKRSEAQAILDKLKTTKEYVSPAELAVLYFGLGDKEGALTSLERAYAAHDLQMQSLKIDSHYDSLRSDPRFQDLLRRVGLPQ
jgi:serine/threonine protein kinase/TolB-like protein/Flp pilus assembly protein TadD